MKHDIILVLIPTIPSLIVLWIAFLTYRSSKRIEKYSMRYSAESIALRPYIELLNRKRREGQLTIEKYKERMDKCQQKYADHDWMEFPTP